MKYRISSFKCLGAFLILGLLGVVFIRGDVYERVAFNSKIKVEEIEIICQFKTIRYFLNHAV